MVCGERTGVVALWLPSASFKNKAQYKYLVHSFKRYKSETTAAGTFLSHIQGPSLRKRPAQKDITLTKKIYVYYM